MEVTKIMEGVGSFLETAVWIIGILVIYQVAFRVIGFLFKAKKFKPTDKRYRYAVLIPARNEGKVIGELVASIKNQDYPAELIEVFVAADNCTDNTAQAARDAGAIVYERLNPPPELRKKGCALDFLVKNIEKDFGVSKFDGYFIFDADNLLAPNYITEMNKAFADERFDMFNSYINVKNFGTSLIASFSSITLYDNTCNVTRPMSHLGLSHRMRGTGCLFRSHFLENGYQWQNICEDNQFSVCALTRGYRSVCQESAEFFDEQPPAFRFLIRQRIRWTKGLFLLWVRYTPRLLFGFFFPYDFKKRAKKDIQNAEQQTRPKKRKFNVLTEIQKRISIYHIWISLTPTALLTLIYGVLYPLAQVTCVLFVPSYQPDLLSVLMPTFIYYAGVYLGAFFSNLITIIREHRKMRIDFWRLVVYLFFWPLISIFVGYACLVAFFLRVKWKPIPHCDNKKIENIYEDKTLAEKLYQK